MPRRPRHPKKEVEAAIAQVLDSGAFRLVEHHGRGHRWGSLLCLAGHREHRIAVWSTPRSTDVHAQQIRRQARRILDLHEQESAS